MSEARVAMISGFSPVFNQKLLAHAPKDFSINLVPTFAGDEEKIAAVKNADFLVLHPGNLSERVWRSSRHLKLVQLLRVGYDLVDLDLVKEMGIPFANLKDATSGIVADHTVLLMLAVYRQLLASDRAVHDGRWFAGIEDRRFFEMEDKVVGILGFGNIGARVARRVQGFGCRVQYHNRRRFSENEEARLGIRYAGLRDLLATSDIVVVLVPLTPETRHIIGRGELRLMKPTAILVNTGRGPLVDEGALIEALQGNWIAGAGLDVVDPMPPRPDNPLLALDNVVVTPYTAAEAEEKAPRIARFAWRNVQNVLDGKEPEGRLV